MEIVKATPDDVETLVKISLKTFYEAFHHLNTPENMDAYMGRAFTSEKLLSELQHPYTDFYFVKDHDEVIGYMKLNRKDAQSEFHEGDSMELERIYVDAGYQGTGLGTLLLHKVRETAIECGCNFIWLGVWEQNPNAIRFYRRNGFEIYSSHPFQMGDDVQTDMLMIARVRE
ncbi:MAG: GNAT family N-acetyltransferase [Saprospiraceae bacterium]